MKRIIALLLAVLMLLALCACGAKDEAPAEAPAAPAAPPPAGETSGEPSGNPPTPEFYEPTNAYAKDFEGYRQYCIDAFATDPGAPAELKDAYNAEFKAMADDTGTTVQALIGLGLICSYEDFLAY